MPAIQRRFAAFPSAFLHDKPGGKRINQLIWGDYVGVTGPENAGWLPVRVRNQQTGWVKSGDVQDERLLEIVFVDIGQGDGALVITPDDKFLVVDAGQADNMARFLRWRFRDKEPIEFEYGVMSHSDMDHYGGFQQLFNTPNFTFKTICTNGLMERAGGGKNDLLGPRVDRGAHSYIEELVTNRADLETFLADASKISGKKYPSMLKAALTAGKVADFRMLSAVDKHLPGYEKGKKIEIEVLGPVIERGSNGTAGLRWFTDPGKTKNGHSVVLRLVYKNLSVLLGGDLNIPAEHLLLEHHTGLRMPPKTEDERAELIAAARKIFTVDIAKACHHGSADFTSEFLASLNPLVTVISSGDDEPHSHPRPDTLGAIGKNSRDLRPLIFSTELSRSAPERIKSPLAVRAELDDLLTAAVAASTAKKKAALAKKKAALSARLNRSVAVYGAINVRSDGNRAVVAQMLERAGTNGKRWDVYALEPDAHGILRYASKHE